MSCYLGCKDNSTSGSLIEPVEEKTLCVRCFTFWVLVVVFVIGLLGHYHKTDGSVRF